MKAWLTENLSTIIIGSIVALIIGAVIFSLVRAKKKGKSSCGCSCSECPMSTSCRPGGNSESNKLKK